MKKEKNTTFKKKIFFTLLLFVSLLSLFAFVFVFMNGFHNLDLGQNIVKLETAYSIDLIDTTNYGQMTGNELYIQGGEQMKGGLYGVFVSALFIGFSIGLLTTSK